MKSITVQADERLIEAAEARARLEHTTLDEKIQLWLTDYAGRETRGRRPAIRLGDCAVIARRVERPTTGLRPVRAPPNAVR